MKAGQLVEVRSKKEILRTLDKRGTLEGLPFMPQMFNYCGKRFRIAKVAHKTCDTHLVNKTVVYQGRKMERTVFLEELRCNGASHGNCHASCLLFWKEVWLKTLDGKEPSLPNYFGPKPSQLKVEPACTEEDVRAGTRSLTTNNFVCQATQLTAATVPLSPFDLRQYIEDYRSGNVQLWRMCCSFIYLGFFCLCNAGLKLGRPLRFLYNAFQGLYGGPPYPRTDGEIPLGKPTPVENLNLQPGELVRVKSYKEILATLDKWRRNRGMSFVPEQVPYCGRTFRVAKRLNQIIDERSGRMLEFKTPSILLEGAVCAGRYTEFCLFCPRGGYPYWREVWLERVPNPPISKTTTIGKCTD